MFRNNLTNLVLTDCPNLQTFNASDNQVPGAVLDASLQDT